MSKQFLHSWKVWAAGSLTAGAVGAAIAGWIEWSWPSVAVGVMLGLILGGAAACLFALLWVGVRHGDRRRLSRLVAKSVVGGAWLLLLSRALGWRAGQPLWPDVVLVVVVAPLFGLFNETLDQFAADEVARAESGETPAG